VAFSFSFFTGISRSKVCKNDLLIADQHASVARTLPWMYLLIISQQVVSWLNARFLDMPIFLELIFLFLTIFSVLRAGYWWSNRANFDGFSVERKKKDLRSVTVMGPVLALFFSGFSSYVYVLTGDLKHALMGVSIVALSTVGAFSLYVMPVAAIGTLLAALLPLALAFLLVGTDNLVLLGTLLLAILVFSVFLLAENFRSFADLVLSRARLEEEKVVSQRVVASVDRLAYYDALTDLPNRRKFIQLLGDAQEETENGAPGFAVGVIDIAGFKAIDDAYGRAAGDALLRQIADRISSINEKSPDSVRHVARLGGDEFVFIAPEIENVCQAYDFGKVLCKILHNDFELAETKVNLSFSCGFALFPYSDSNPDRLIARADLARKVIAEQGGDVAGVFSLELESASVREANVKQALGGAISKGTIEPWFQPIVRIENGEICGFEALARWNDPELGDVSPTEFIEIAEQSQLIEELTLLLFRKSLTVAKGWSQGTKLFYNLSAKSLGRQKSIEKMLTILKESGFPPSHLEIELTETAVMDDIELAKKQMQKFRDAGVGIALDDFGSGYSSLAQIRDLPLDKVKIDKSFTDQICTDAKIRSIVEAIILLCQKIEITCVVEGIEDLEQLGLLSDMGCEFGQGYLFSRPIPAYKTTRRMLLVNAA